MPKWVAGTGTLMLVAACAPAGVPSSRPPRGGESLDASRCKAVSRPTEPSLTGWSAADRAQLNALRRQGIVAVRYSARGCNVELEVLTNCIADGTYLYTPSPSQTSESYRNAQELFADLPLGAARLSGKLKGDRLLRTDLRITGIASVATGKEISANDLHGPDCAKATHLVQSLTLGAFAMAAGSSRDLQATGNLFGLGAGTSHQTSFERVFQDGLPEACDVAVEQRREDANCAVPLRVSLRPLGAAAPPCSPGSHRQAGAGCVPDVTSPAPIPGPQRGPAMIAIPSGTFHMGSNVGEKLESPEHAVTVAAFQIDATEVTVRQYTECVEAGACSKDKLRSCGATGTFGRPDRRNHPVNCVSGDDARAFCQWAGKRLPTEAEWEYAARGTDSRRYPWGNEPPDKSRINGGTQGTAPVGKHPAGRSPFGVEDMEGNVSEWTATAFCPYTAPECGSSSLAIRGSSWGWLVPEWTVSTRRGGWPPVARTEYLGFRCAR